ncbi:roundabout homolog 2-like [Montipora capricornis]|uniref:roundabout homolog 2-like n=1 Tax=Montipora capricornis TaxID=246305 RepID=UPI0035F1335B
MLVVSLTLVLFFLGTPLSNGELTFSKEPGATVYQEEGHDVEFVWDFERTEELFSVNWFVVNKTTTDRVTLWIEDENGTQRGPSTPPLAYAHRLERKGRGTLIVKNVTQEDSTSFQCRLDGKDPGVQTGSSTRLVVTGLCRVHQSVQVTNPEGSTRIICNATDVPGQQFKWRKRGEINNTLYDDGMHAIVSTTGSSVLTIQNITHANDGYYTCFTVNIQKSCSDSSYVQLLEPLKLDDTFSHGRPIFTAVNVTQTLCCPVNGYPPPIVTWEKNGTKLQTGENKCFTIASVKSSHFGNYSCIGTDGKTTIGPVVLSLVEKEEPVPDQLTLSGIDGTTDKPAKLEWEPLTGATYYVVNVDGSDIYGDAVIGARTSLEIHYNTLVMLKGDVDPPRETEICADVTAFSSEAGVIGKAPKCQKLMVKKPSDGE